MNENHAKIWASFENKKHENIKSEKSEESIGFNK